MINFRQENFLFKQNERCSDDELFGEEKVLHNPIIDVALDRIMEDYTPSHKKVIFSLCTSTRPYLKGIKWKTFYENFGNYCDLIICSNGGIIPMEYMNCWPYLTYDAHSSAKFDDLYNELFEKRLTKFLGKFGNCWEKKIFTFLPSSRNRRVIEKLGYEALLPSIEVYNDVREHGSPGVNILRYPQCAEQCLNEMARVLEVPRNKTQGRKKLF